jgi:hypothetical protein
MSVSRRGHFNSRPSICRADVTVPALRRCAIKAMKGADTWLRIIVAIGTRAGHQRHSLYPTFEQQDGRSASRCFRRWEDLEWRSNQDGT